MMMFASRRKSGHRGVWEEGSNSFNLTPLNLKRRSRIEDYVPELPIRADVKNAYQTLDDQSQHGHDDDSKDDVFDTNTLRVPPRKDKRISLPATLHPPTSKKEKRASFTPSLLTAAKKDKRASLTPSLLTPGGTSRKDKRISFTPSLAPSFRSFAPPSSPLSPQARSVMFAEETKIRQYEQRYARESGPLDMHMHLAPKSDIARRRSSIIVPRAIERRPDAKLFPSIHVPGLPLGLSLEQLLRGAIHKIIPGMIVDAYPSKVSHSNDPFARLSFEKNQEVQIKVADIKAEFTKHLASTPKPVAGNWFLVKDHRGKSVGRGFYVAWRSTAGVKTWVKGVQVTNQGTVKAFGSETESEVKSTWRPTMWAAM